MNPDAPRIGDFSAAERNKTAIFEVLVEWFGALRHVLEIGAGDGTHARHARRELPHLVWQTSEVPAHLPRLTTAFVDARDDGLPAPLALDVQQRWPDQVYDAVFAANVAHIMSEDAVAALFAGAGAHLAGGGLLCIYGPFFAADETPGPGNLAFHEALRARDLAMGIRTLEMLDAFAVEQQLLRVARRSMPSDNRLLIWRKNGGNRER